MKILILTMFIAFSLAFFQPDKSKRTLYRRGKKEKGRRVGAFSDSSIFDNNEPSSSDLLPWSNIGPDSVLEQDSLQPDPKPPLYSPPSITSSEPTMQPDPPNPPLYSLPSITSSIHISDSSTSTDVTTTSSTSSPSSSPYPPATSPPETSPPATSLLLTLRQDNSTLDSTSESPITTEVAPLVIQDSTLEPYQASPAEIPPPVIPPESATPESTTISSIGNPSNQIASTPAASSTTEFNSKGLMTGLLILAAVISAIFCTYIFGSYLREKYKSPFPALGPGKGNGLAKSGGDIEKDGVEANIFNVFSSYSRWQNQLKDLPPLPPSPLECDSEFSELEYSNPMHDQTPSEYHDKQLDVVKQKGRKQSDTFSYQMEQFFQLRDNLRLQSSKSLLDSV